MTPDGHSEWKPRNTSWLKPLGCTCLGCLGVMGIGLVLGATSLFSFFSGAVKSTGTYQSYQLAADRLKTNPEVIAALGEPVASGWVSKSSEHYNNNQGATCIRFSISGSRTNGSAYVETRLEQGSWQFHQFTVRVNGEPNPIVLVSPPPNLPASLCPDFDKPDASPSSLPSSSPAVPQPNSTPLGVSG